MSTTAEAFRNLLAVLTWRTHLDAFKLHSLATIMALIPCPTCGKQISTRARACPQCKTPLSVADNSVGQVRTEHQQATPTSLALELNMLPPDLRSKLFPEESVRHFGYIDRKGGCLSATTANQWILVTNQRILFEAAVREGAEKNAKYAHQSGSIPMAKVSFVGTSTTQTTEGCTQVKTTELHINSSGGQIMLAIPTKEEAARIQNVIDGIISNA